MSWEQQFHLHSRCRHTSSDAHISWRVNGSPVGRFPDIRSGSIDESGIIVSTLTIPAEPQYNGTVVECVAVFFDGPIPNLNVSPPATIFFVQTDSLHFPTYIYCILTYWKKIDIHCIAAFEITPSPLTVAVEQGTATFQYQHPLAVSIGWRVNGILQNVANLPNVSTATPNDVTKLSIATLVAYNGTIIECIATFFDGSLPQFTAPVSLLTQGIHTVILMHAVRASTIIFASFSLTQ